MYERNIFGKRLFSLFQESGCKTYSEFAEKLGISRQSLDHYINGDRIPPANYLAQIAEATGVSADWLLGLSDCKRHESETITAAELGLSEDTIQILRNSYQWHNTSGAQLIDIIAADMGYSRDGNRSLADLINYYLSFEYQAGNQAINKYGAVFNPGGGGLPQGSIRLDQKLIESAILQEITLALRNIKQANREATQQGKTLIEYYRATAAKPKRGGGVTAPVCV